MHPEKLSVCGRNRKEKLFSGPIRSGFLSSFVFLMTLFVLSGAYVRSAEAVNKSTATAFTAPTIATTITYGASITFTASVAASPAVGVGTVTFQYGSTTICSGTVASGSASCSTTSLPVGTYPGGSAIVANYSGGVNGNTTYSASTGTLSVSITVNKPTPSVTAWPTASAITYGQTLAASNLTGGSSTPAGTFAFTTPSTAPGVGTASQGVTFTPNDTVNYNTATGTVSVTVNKANSDVTVWPTASAITYGQTLANSALTGGSSTPAGSFAFTTPATAPSVGTASQDVTFTPTDATNYNIATGTVSVTVNKANQATLNIVAPESLTYGSTATLSTTGGSGTGAVTYSAGGSTGCSVAGTTLSVTDAIGTCSVTATKAADTDYNAAISSGALVTPQKTNASVTVWPTATAITYGQTLVDSTLTGGSSTPAGTFAFTTSSTAPGVGTATQGVTFTPSDAVNYNTATGVVSVTVNKANAAITWPTTASAITYGQTLANSTLTGGSSTPAGSFAFTTPATAPSVGTASQGVTFTPSDAVNYNTATGTVSVTVNKANSDVTVWPTADAITYGQTLANSALTGGSSTPAGTFAFTTPATAPGVGTALQGVTFTPSDAANYNTATGTVSVTVNKANSSVTAWPTATAITYGQTLADSTLTGGSSTPAGTFAFTTSSTAPGVGTATQGVTFTPSDFTNYNTATGTVSVTVNKANPSVTTWPLATAITYGQTLASSTLSGGAATPAGTFAFTTPGTVPAIGITTQGVTFTPNDTTNYNTATGTVSVTVNKANSSVTIWPTASAIIYGQTLAASILTGGSSTPAGSFAFTTPATAPSVGAASQGVTFTPTDATNYNTVTGTVSVTVNKANAAITWPTAGAITYGQTLADSALTGGSSTPSGTFAFATSLTAPAVGTTSQGVTFTPSDAVNYNTATGTVSVTVNKANSDVTVWPTADAITYGQTLANSALTGGSSTPAGTFAFTTPATAPGVGTALQGVTFTPSDAANYNTATGTVSVTVNKANSSVTVWPTASAIIYGQTLADSALTGGSSTPSGTFAFATPSTAPAVGTTSQGVTFTPSDAVNYNTATGTVSVTVNKANSSVTAWPTATAITYGQTLANSALTGGSSTPAGSFAFTTPATAPSVGTASQDVTFTPTDATNYNTATGTVSVTVNKANAAITWPIAGAITYGQTLADSTLTGGSSTPVGSFAFTTPSTAPGAGTASQSVTFTPGDATNYNTATGTISVTVNKANSNVTAWPTASAITYDQTLASSTLSGGAATPTGTFAFTTPSTTPTTGTATQGVTFTPSDAINYNTAAGTVSVTVNKANAAITWPTTASAITYGQTLANSTLTGGSSIPAGTFAFTTSATAPGVGTASQGVTFTPGDATNYNTATGTVSVTVNKANTTTTVNAGILGTPTVVGESYAVSYTVAVAAPGAGTPTGNVTVSDGSATCIAAASSGTCNIISTTVGAKTITASYAGDNNFNTSNDAAGRSHTVGKTDQTITVGTPAPANASYNSQFTVAATASSSLAVTYSSGNPAVCTNVGATFTMVTASGTCVVQYDQAGNGTYHAALQVTENTTAVKANQSDRYDQLHPDNGSGRRHNNRERDSDLRVGSHLHQHDSGRLHRSGEHGNGRKRRNVHDSRGPDRQWQLQCGDLGRPDLHNHR